LGAGLKIKPREKVIVKKPHRGGQDPNWAVEPYDEDDDNEYFCMVYHSLLK
jgi:hypothetical protein